MRFCLLISIFLILAECVFAKELVRLENCRYIATEWADGDSFQIKTAEGEKYTVRLYGVDCIESAIRDDSDARRLRAQRRYFGISEYKNSSQESIALAKSYGKKAAERAAELLSEPFTVITTFADGRGDRRYKRIYAFVELGNGEGMAEVLVKEGLARAYGVTRQTPSGMSQNDWREELRDLELQAAKNSRGVWEHTNWEKLPMERRVEREEEASLRVAIDGGTLPPEKSVDVNSASMEELMSLPHIGEMTAIRIIEKRPYTKISSLMAVKGIGQKTLQKITPYIVIGAAKDEAPLSIPPPNDR